MSLNLSIISVTGTNVSGGSGLVIMHLLLKDKGLSFNKGESY
jgi:hypothetical protein